MKKIKIFPKMFIQIFSVLAIIIILVHSLVYFIFPKTYLETRKEKIHNIANEISSNMNGKEIKYIEQTLELYSKSSEIKAFIKEKNNKNEIQIKDDINVNLESDSNSLIIEEREIMLNDGEKINLQFVSTADMQKDAKDLSIKFLPYSLFISILFSAIISLIYAKIIKNNIQEIKIVTDKMMELDKETRLKVNSNDEVGELKQQINDLYSTLLRTIDNLEFKNKEILKLEKLKYDFFKGASHELKTPLASLKIILENMKYNIGKYKERDIYINECIDIVDSLTKNISQILSVHSIENLNNDEEYLKINDTLEDILKKYEILANQKKITVNNYISDENIYIGKNVEINMNCVFLDCNKIVIGDNSGIGPGVHIYTVFHSTKALERTSENSTFWKSQTAPVIIGNNVWIGGGCIILPGVTIGDNTTIGAGSVVTKSIPANVLAVGNPCRILKQIED